MKMLRHTIVCLFFAAFAAGQGGPAPAASASPPAGEDLATLEQFLNLSDAELAQVQQVIARLRAMTPAQRAALREEIAAFRRLPEPQRVQLRQGWGQMPADIRDGWREMMQGISPAKHAEIQAKLQSLSPDEKVRYRRELVDAHLKAKATAK